MSTGIKPEWDMPPDGDFARYVDQLTASPPAPAVGARPVAAQEAASASSQSPGPSIRPPALANPQSSSLPPGLQRVLPTLVSGLRLVLLALSVAHIAALLAWGRGSWVGVLMMVSLWWGLGPLGPLGVRVAKVLNTPGADAQSIQNRLRQARLQRTSTKKKP